MKSGLAGIAAALCLSGGAAAQEATLAEAGLQGRIDVLRASADANPFEIGMLVSLRAAEKAMQARYQYGFGDALAMLPMLRLDAGAPNPAPTAIEPDTLSGIFRTALADFDTARADLARAAGAGIDPFRLSLQDIWFDIDQDGRRGDGETMLARLAPALLGPRAMAEIAAEGVLDTDLVVRFDVADHAWLTAYTHMLSGVGNLVLAFDPAPVLKDLADSRAALESAPETGSDMDAEALAAEIEALQATLAGLQEEVAPVQSAYQALRAEISALHRDETPDRDRIDTLSREADMLRRERLEPLRRETALLRDEIAAARARTGGPDVNMFLPFRDDVDAIYVFLASLRQQPDAARIRAVHDHWLQMIDHNRAFWDALFAETDNEDEWIPNPAQTSALGITVEEDLARSWQAILRDAEDVLNGRLLLAHPLLPEGTGIDVAAYVGAPTALDPVDWFHGIGAYPFAAKGPRISDQRWIAFQRLAGGNAGGYALLFN